MDGGSGEELLNCTLRFDSKNYKILAGLRAAAGFISFVCCVFVIFIIILFKKYKFFAQRLILNLAVASMVHAITYTTARVNYYTVRPIEDPYCYFGGLVNHYTAAVELISIWCVTINIFSVGMRGKNTAKVEPIYVIATYALPLLWFWVPIWKEAYGTSGGWCGIKSVQEDCTPFTIGPYIVFGIWYIPLYISTFLIATMMFIVVAKILYRQHSWKGTYDMSTARARQAVRDEIKPLLWYPFIYMLLNAFSVISQIYNAIFPTSPSAVLPYLRVLSSFRGAVIAIVFALDKTTRKRLNRAHFRAAIQSRFSTVEPVEIRPIEDTTQYGDQDSVYSDQDYSSSAPYYRE